MELHADCDASQCKIGNNFAPVHEKLASTCKHLQRHDSLQAACRLPADVAMIVQEDPFAASLVTDVSDA